MKKKFTYCPFCGSVLKSGFIDGKERQHCAGCRFVDYKNPLPVAVAMAVRGRRFLIIKRGIAPRKGAWGFPQDLSRRENQQRRRV
jgi:hypothetical protein